MPRTWWSRARDKILLDNYPVLGPTHTASLLGTSPRAVINRAHRLGLRAPYPKDRSRPGFPPKHWSRADKLLAEALLSLFRSSPSYDDNWRSQVSSPQSSPPLPDREP